MYSVSEDFASKIIANNREFATKITFNSSTEITGTTAVQSFVLDEIVNSGENLTLGCACSNKIVVNLINPPTDIDYSNSFFTAEEGLKLGVMPLTYEYVPLGKFYVSDVETDNDYKTLKITAYDGFYKMTGKYIATVSEETTLQAVYDDLRAQLLEQCGITLKERELPEYVLIFPYLDITFQQAIGYVAGCLGGFARFDRKGELEIAEYTDYGVTIDGSLQYMNGFKRLTEKALIITSLSTGTKDKPIVRGVGANGTAITYENPYMTDEMADAVFDKFNTLMYVPAKVQWRGNPAVQAGDIVQVIDSNGAANNVLIMGQTLKIGGGLNATIECKGSSETKSEFSNKYESASQKIDRVYSQLANQILEATNKITGNRGGYVILHDTNDDGKPDEILIMDYEDISIATKVWRWNKEGLGYSHNAAGNAYLGPYETAITADGEINADFITVGTLNAERIAVETYDDVTGLLTDYIHFDKGTITLGEGQNALTLKLGNGQVAFYHGDVRKAYFSSNSFEIENLTDGKVRFQNFGFIPRKSGNLTFTRM